MQRGKNGGWREKKKEKDGTGKLGEKAAAKQLCQGRKDRVVRMGRVCIYIYSRAV